GPAWTYGHQFRPEGRAGRLQAVPEPDHGGAPGDADPHERGEHIEGEKNRGGAVPGTAVPGPRGHEDPGGERGYREHARAGADEVGDRRVAHTSGSPLCRTTATTSPTI